MKAGPTQVPVGGLFRLPWAEETMERNCMFAWRVRMHLVVLAMGQRRVKRCEIILQVITCSLLHIPKSYILLVPLCLRDIWQNATLSFCM